MTLAELKATAESRVTLLSTFPMTDEGQGRLEEARVFLDLINRTEEKHLVGGWYGNLP